MLHRLCTALDHPLLVPELATARGLLVLGRDCEARCLCGVVVGRPLEWDRELPARLGRAGQWSAAWWLLDRWSMLRSAAKAHPLRRR